MPHVSLGWLPGDRSEELQGAVEDLSRQQGETVAGMNPRLAWTTSVDEVCCMIGERVYTLWPWAPEHRGQKRPRHC